MSGKCICESKSSFDKLGATKVVKDMLCNEQWTVTMFYDYSGKEEDFREFKGIELYRPSKLGCGIESILLPASYCPLCGKEL